jgi:hypothetical protein
MKTKSLTATIDAGPFYFEPEGHKYFCGKKRIPSVSEMLAKVGLSKDYKGVDPFYRDRGIATHKAIELYLQGNLDPTSLDEAIKHQFEAFLQYWDAHHDEKILALEKPFCDRDQRFAGTPDLITDRAIYDWKCSKEHDRVADLQGQAYKVLVDQCFPPEAEPLPFIVVELHDDGTAAEFNYGVNWDEWDSVLRLHRWKTR